MLQLVYSSSVSSTSSIEERVTRGGALQDLRLEDVVRLMGDSAANGDKNDPVVFSGLIEVQMRALLPRYGFERLPLTYGELYGLLDYVEALNAACGTDMFDTKEEHRAWQGNLDVWRKHWPELFPALDLYAKSDIKGLLDYHRENDTLTKLGREFNEFNRRR